MYLFTINTAQRLHTYENMKYRSVAWDGCSFLFLERTGRMLLRHCDRLAFQEAHPTRRPYVGLCYDNTDHCVWTFDCGDNVYRLDNTLREQERLPYSAGGRYGPLRAIAHEYDRDCLVLTFARRTVYLDKRTGSELPEDVCARSFIYRLRHLRHGDILTISHGEERIQACLPGGHRVLGMAESRICGQPALALLSSKQGCFHLLQGVLTGGEEHIVCSRPMLPGRETQCGGERNDKWHEHNCFPAVPPCCGWEKSHDDPDDHPCRHGTHHHGSHVHGHEHPHHGHGWLHEHDWSHHHNHPHDHKHGHDHTHHGHGHDDVHHDHEYPHIPIVFPADWNWSTSFASIVESIALEQTALSHILNAEGEKIQKVIAVSDRPTDFLEVNHSVMEVINRVTYLEQVLCAKLELASRMLREHKTERNDTAG